MRRKNIRKKRGYKLLIVDDEIGIIDSLTVVFERHGYCCEGETNPVQAIEKVRKNHYDVLILDFLMQPIHGDKVVESIRKFNKELYILLLTGHKDLAPPLETVKRLDIQGYCEKSDRFDQILLLVESGVKSIEQMRIIRKYSEGFEKILRTVPGVYKLNPVEDILKEAVKNLSLIVDGENGFALIKHKDMKGELAYAGKGIYEGTYRDAYDDIMLFKPGLLEGIEEIQRSNLSIKKDGYVMLSLCDESRENSGVLYVESDIGNEEMNFLEIYANQISSAVNNAILHDLVNIKNEELKGTYEDLKKFYLDTIETLRLVVDAKDVYTRGHSDRVSYYCVKIGRALNLDEDEIEKLRIAGIFHDVGKIGTNDDILFKAGRLSSSEYEEIKKHPIKGAHILSAMSAFKDIGPIIEAHHEHVDGTGYPYGLKGDEIPYLARILAVADAFDAMVTYRIYRVNLELTEAKKQLAEGAGTQFDREIVEVFLGLLENYEEMEKEIVDIIV